MRHFPSCSGENGVQVADASCSSVNVSKASQNSVTCVYKCQLFDEPCLVSVIWGKNLMGQSLSVEIDCASYQCISRVDVKPSLFSKRKGSKCFEFSAGKIRVFWDLSLAKFGPRPDPEPLEGYYVGAVCEGVMVLIIGDMTREAFKETSAIASLSRPIFISKRAHICGKKVFYTRAQFCDNGQIHNLKLECVTSSTEDLSLVIFIDMKMVMQVRHLRWKFRGNHTILVDGIPVEVFWDVHD